MNCTKWILFDPARTIVLEGIDLRVFLLLARGSLSIR